MNNTSLVQIHGTFARRSTEGWVYMTLGPRLLRLAGEETLAVQLESADDERLWGLHFYGVNLVRPLPGFGVRPKDVPDLYKEALDTMRRLPADAYDRTGWVTTLLCGLRYHPQIGEVIEQIHEYANLRRKSQSRGFTPDWRVTSPPEADFATPPSQAKVGRLPVWLRATGSRKSRLVWRVYADEACTRYLGDLVTGTSEGLKPFEARGDNTLVSDSTGIVVRGKFCPVEMRGYLIV